MDTDAAASPAARAAPETHHPPACLWVSALTCFELIRSFYKLAVPALETAQVLGDILCHQTQMTSLCDSLYTWI